MKKILVRGGIVVVALVIIALVVVFLSLNSIVKKGVETVGPMITKVDVHLGAAEISPFSGSGRLTKFFVGNPSGFKTPSAMQVGDIKVAVSPGSVFSDTIVVNEVNVQAAEITLEGSLSGNNLTKILDNVSGAGGGEAKTKSGAASNSPKKFIVKDLVIEGAKVNLNIDVALLGSKSMTVTIPAIHLQNIGTAENGVTAEQLVMTVMKPLIVNITTAATEALANSATDLSKGGVKDIGKATKGITDLFKK